MAKTRKQLSAGQITPPVEFDYDSQAEMIADQGNQDRGFIYFDGTDHWEYLGSTTGTISDYRAIGGSFTQVGLGLSIDNEGNIVLGGSGDLSFDEEIGLSYNKSFFSTGSLNDRWIPDWEAVKSYTNSVLTLPDGVTVKGTVTQDGNDITLNDAWRWRINNIIYGPTGNTTLNFPSTSAGFHRIDLVVGNTSGVISRVAGAATEVENPVFAPSAPVGTAPLLEVFILETGINSFIEFALTSFVRYDINNQGLSPVQRQNARTNIEALSRDTNDTRTAILNQLSGLNLVGESVNNTARSHHIIRNGVQGSGTTKFFGTNGGANRQHFEWFGNGDVLHTQVGNGHVSSNQPTWRFFNPIRINGARSDVRSSTFDRVTRRDELPLTYPQTISDSGTLNNLAITAGVGAIVVTSATDITGIVGESGRMLRIYASGASRIIRNNSGSSDAANRFDIPTGDFTIQNGTYADFIYINSRWRPSTANTGLPISILNSTGDEEFTFNPLEGIRFAGSGDTSVSFNSSTKTITITSIPGAGGGGAVTSFNGRDGAVVSITGDYNTGMVPESGNLYFTEARVRSTALTGLSVTNSVVTATDSVIVGFGKLQGQINNLVPITRTIAVNGTAGRIIVPEGTQTLADNRIWTVDLATTGVSAGTYTAVTVDVYGRVTVGSSLSLTGDVSSSGTNPLNVTINPQAVTYNKIQNVTGNRLLGRLSSTGQVQELTSAQVRSFLNIVDYVHPTGFTNQPGTALTGAAVISRITVNNEGHVTGVSTRNLTLGNLGYTGATNADNYNSWLLAVTGVSGTSSITSGSTVTFTAGTGISITRSGSTVTINSTVTAAGTNLSIGSNTSTVVRVDSSTGSNATLPVATASLAGIMTAANQVIGGSKSFSSNTVIGSTAAPDGFQRLDIVSSSLRGIRIRGNTTSWTGIDFTIERTGSNSDLVGRGPSIELYNSTTDVSTRLQQSTGGLRIFYFASSTWTNIATFNSNGTLSISGQATNTTHVVRADRTIQGLDGLVVNGSTAAQNLTSNLTIGVGSGFALDRLFIAKGVRTNAGTFTVSAGVGFPFIMFQNTLAWLSSYYAPRVCIEMDCYGVLTTSNSITTFQVMWNFGGSDDVTVVTASVPSSLNSSPIVRSVHIKTFLTINNSSVVKLGMTVKISGTATSQSIFSNAIEHSINMNNNYDIRLRGRFLSGSGNSWGETQTVVKVF